MLLSSVAIGQSDSELIRFHVTSGSGVSTMRLNVLRGAYRLWFLLTVTWFVGISLYALTVVYTDPPCFAFRTITVDETHTGPMRQSARDFRNTLLSGRVFCTRHLNSELLTVESYARHGVYSQVSLIWREPIGWSMDTRDWLIVLEGREITAGSILEQTGREVHKARLIHVLPSLIGAAVVPFIILALGAGFAWVARGFRAT